jgi:hypothetical protein
MGARRRLQRVLVARDLIPDQGVLQRVERRQQPVGELGRVLGLVAGEQLVILARPVGHPGERHRLHDGQRTRFTTLGLPLLIGARSATPAPIH